LGRKNEEEEQGGRRREGKEVEEKGDEPPLPVLAGFATGPGLPAGIIS